MAGSHLSIATLPIPQISGFLSQNGYEDVEWYDVSREAMQRLSDDPGAFDLSVFDDRKTVDAFLRGESNQAGVLPERLLRWLEVDRADLFGLSVWLSECATAARDRLIDFNLCLVSSIKRRYPQARIAVGGLRAHTQDSVRQGYLEMLDRCRDLDFAIDGPAEGPLLRIIRRMEGKEAPVGPGFSEQKRGEGVFFDASVSYYDPVKPEIPFVVSDIVPRFLDAEDYRYTGDSLVDFYRLDEQDRLELAGRLPGACLPLPLAFAWGCSGRCGFCASSLARPMARDVQDVVRTIARLRESYDSRYFVFFNPCINWTYEYAMALANALIDARLDILWTDSLCLHHLDGRLIERLRESGFIRADIGCETASDRLLRYCRKPTPRERMARMLKLLSDNGVWNHINLITGLPTETDDDVGQTLDFIAETADSVNAYNINAFYLIDVSDMGTNPDRYGIELSPPARLEGLEYLLPFEQTNGVGWAEHRKRAVEAYRRTREAIAAAKGYNEYYDRLPDFHLLFLLYDAFGFSGKGRIERMVERFYDRLRGGNSRSVAQQRRGRSGRPSPRLQAAADLFAMEETVPRFGGLTFRRQEVVSDRELKIVLEGGGRSVELGVLERRDPGPALVRGENYSVFYYRGPGAAERDGLALRASRHLLAFLERSTSAGATRRPASDDGKEDGGVRR